MARANAFAEGDPNAADPDHYTRRKRSSRRKKQPALEMDPVLLDIFSKETAGHLKVIRRLSRGMRRTSAAISM